MAMTVQQKIAGTSAPYRFSQRDYILLSENGAFDKLAKTELIEGVIIAVNAQYSRHARVQTLLFRALANACDAIGDGVGAWIDASISIDDGSMPRPDLFVSRGLPEDGPVTLDRLLIVIEIADSSLRYDLGEKAALYATAGIAEYWVADVHGEVMHQMYHPDGGRYAGRSERPFGAEIVSASVPALKFVIPKV